MKLYTVRLSIREQNTLQSILTKGVCSARVFTRAQILLKAHKKLMDATIADHLDCTVQHVERIRKRYCTEGIDRALSENARSGKPPIFTSEQKTRIVALACTEPPDEADHWTGELLAEKSIETGVVPKISKQTIWLIMKEHDLKPWREKNVVHPKAHARVQGTDGGSPRSVRQAVRSEGAGDLPR